VNKSEIRLNHEVDALIRDNKTDSKTASLRINEIGLAPRISKKLLSAVITLWARNEEVKKLGDEYEYE
jgi:hypothetical protein